MIAGERKKQAIAEIRLASGPDNSDGVMPGSGFFH